MPIVRRSIAIGERIWRVEMVEDQEALLSASEGRALFPFGLMLWESAVALAVELSERAAFVTGKTVLELGAGLGLCGVVAAHLGARVVQTDHDVAALAACQRTAALNGVTGISCAIGDWHDWHDISHYDLIIGADVAYDGADHAALFDVFERNLAAGGCVLLADPGREKQTAFLQQAQAAGWTVERTVRHVDPIKSVSRGTKLAIAILDLRRGQRHTVVGDDISGTKRQAQDTR